MMHHVALLTLICDSKEEIPHTWKKISKVHADSSLSIFPQTFRQISCVLKSAHAHYVSHPIYLSQFYHRNISANYSEDHKTFKDRILATHHQYCQQWMIWSSQVAYITKNCDVFTDPSNYRMCKSSSGEQPESP